MKKRYDASKANESVVSRPLWDWLAYAIERTYGRYLRITDGNGETALATRMPRTCRILGDGLMTFACRQYYRDMSRLAINRSAARPTEDYAWRFARHVTLARCPAGYINLAIPQGDTVFHLTGGCLKELDLPDQRLPDAQAIGKCLSDRLEYDLPDEGPERISTDLAEYLCSKTEQAGWEESDELGYGREVMGWLTTASPLARLADDDRRSEPIIGLMKKFGIYAISRHRLRDAQRQFALQAELHAKDLGEFLASCEDMYMIVTRSADIIAQSSALMTG